MGRTRFVEESELARPGDPCPICGRPGAGEPRSEGVCRISRERERLDEVGRTWLDPRGMRVHCFRVSDPAVPGPEGGTYRARENAGGQAGTFYVLRDDQDRVCTRLVRKSDGTPAKGKSGRAPTARSAGTSPTGGGGGRFDAGHTLGHAPVYTNRLDTEWAWPELGEDQLRMREMARELWADATPMGLALEYLASRGMDRAWLKRDWPDSLAWASFVHCTEAGQDLPAMLCKVSAPDGSHAATHRIYLRADGRGKAEGLTKTKMLLGSQVGGAVRLYEPEPPGLAPGVLFVTEGVETAMAVAQAVRTDGAGGAGVHAEPELDGAGVWAAISSSGLTALALPPQSVRAGLIGKVVLCADVDRSKVDDHGRQMGLGGQRAAVRAQERLRAEFPGLAVSIAWPGMGVLTRWDQELGRCVPGRGA